MLFSKILCQGEEARRKFLSGINKVGDAVGATLGPSGLNFIINEKFRAPKVTNDGVTVARHIVLEDEVEDLAAQTVVDVAMKTNNEVGDGTTTSVVIAQRLIQDCYEKMNFSEQISGTSGVTMANEIYKARETVIEKLKAMAHPLEEGELEKVVSTSMRDKEMGKTIATMLKELGVDGRLSTEDNWETKSGITTEMTLGMKFLGTYSSPYFTTTENQKEAVWKDVDVLVTNLRIESTVGLKKLFDEMREKERFNLVLLCGYSEGESGYSSEAVQRLVVSHLAIRMGKAVGVKVLPVKVPSLTTHELSDVCEYVDAEFIDKALGKKLGDVRINHLGYAKEIVVDEDNVHIKGGRGADLGKASARIEVLKKQIEEEKDQMFEGKLRNRIASLAAAQGVIRVGAATEAERTYIKYKIEDAVNAGKAAMEEGVIAGGGIPLKEIAEEFGKDHILYEALQSPYNKIQENAGGNLVISPDILDPIKVTRLAFENACSAAAQVISSIGAIAEHKKTLAEELQKMIAHGAEHNADFRADENLDYSYGPQVRR